MVVKLHQLSRKNVQKLQAHCESHLYAQGGTLRASQKSTERTPFFAGVCWRDALRTDFGMPVEALPDEVQAWGFQLLIMGIVLDNFVL